ncbi:hypothetical protein KL925_002726 [Ogataea polymorpha]|nr:hypothetical protein KL925_002726 [Ogataea polymorpha]
MDTKIEDELLGCRERFYETFIKDSVNMSLKDLDIWRTETMPDILETRFTKKRQMWLEKAELQRLMKWKLIRGKFRPTLPKLIQSNDPVRVREYTEQAFGVLIDYCDASKDNDNEFTAAVKKSMELACQLRGVGPATSTLILSLAGPTLRKTLNNNLRDIPFFSDEVFEILNPGYGKIRYSTKEYLELVLPKLLLFKNRELQKFEESLWCLHRADKMYGKLDGALANILTSVHELTRDHQLVATRPSKRRKK